jgi:chaperonin GroEL
VEEGIVPGGGVTLLRCAKVLDNIKGANSEEQVGIEIVKKAMEGPIRQLALNAGYDGSIIIEKVLKESNINIGFDVNDGVLKDLMKEGIIDPTKVTRTALQNATSIASLLLTTEAMGGELPEEEKENKIGMPPGGMGGMGGMGGYDDMM